MDKYNVVYPYNAIPFGHKMEWITDARYNVDKTCQHAKWKKPATKDHIQYDPIYTKYPE